MRDGQQEHIVDKEKSVVTSNNVYSIEKALRHLPGNIAKHPSPFVRYSFIAEWGSDTKWECDVKSTT